VFQAKGAVNIYKNYYLQRMKSLASMSLNLPDIYKSLKTFINVNMFGNGEGEAADPGGEEQVEFMKKFYVDLKEEKARRNGNNDRSTDGSGEE
jgi:hypothetical protein